MGLSEKLEMLITLDPSQGIAGMERFSKSAEDNVKKSEAAMSRVGAAAMKLGVAGMGAGMLLTQMGDKEKQSAGQLEAAIGAAGQSVGDYKDKIEEAVKSGEHFGHSAVETNTALTTLVGAYHDTGKAVDQMGLVENLAANRHIDLASAADMVARAHGGSAKLFKLFGIQVEQNIDGTKNYDGALAKLSQQLDGQANASVAGFTGFLKGLRAEVEDQVAAFGAKYGPAIMAGSAAMTAFGGVASGVGAVMGKVKLAHEAAAAAALVDAEATNTSKLAMAGMATAGVAVVAGLAMLANKQTDSSFHFDKLADAAMKADQSALLPMARTISGLSQVTGAFLDPGKQMRDTLDKLASSGDAGVGALVRMRDALKANGEDTSVLDAAIAKAKDSQDGLTASTDAGAAAQDNSAAATKANAAAMKELHDQIHANADPLFAMEKAVLDNGKAQADLTAKQKDAKTSAADLAAAHMHVAETAISVHDAADLLAAGIQAGTISVDGMKVQMASWVSQGLISQETMNTLAWSMGGIVGQAQDLMSYDGKTANIQVIAHFKSIGDLGVAGAKDFHASAAGFSGTVGRPTVFLTGEGGEREDVLIVPHSKGGIGRGGGGGSPNSAMGGNSMTVYIDARGAQQGAGRGIVDALVAHSRNNNAPVALKEWIAS